MLSARNVFIALFTPLARRMGGVSPNTLSLVSLTAGVAAGMAFGFAHRSNGFFALAALLVAVSGAADSLDGIVARMYNRTSAAGEFLDHFADRVVEVSVLVGIAVSPGASITLGLSVVILTLLHSYLGTQIEAAFGRREYSGPGKAEQFVGLVAFGVVRAAAPSWSIPVGDPHMSLADALFALLGAGTILGIVGRLRAARALASAPDAPVGRKDHRQ